MLVMKNFLKARKTKNLLNALNCRFYVEGEDVIPHLRKFFPEHERTIFLLLKRLINADGYSRDGITMKDIEVLSILLDKSLPNPDNVISEIYFYWGGMGYDFIVTQDDKWLYFFPYYSDTKTYALKAQEV